MYLFTDHVILIKPVVIFIVFKASISEAVLNNSYNITTQKTVSQ